MSGRIRLISRSLLVPKTLANAFPIKCGFPSHLPQKRANIYKIKPNTLDATGLLPDATCHRPTVGPAWIGFLVNRG
jgi:hypothetical protein